MKPPLGLAVMVPAELAPSPQVMAALKSAGVAPRLASVKVATVVAGAPSVPVMVVPVALSAASAMVAVLVALAVLPPASMMVTLVPYVPSSAGAGHFEAAAGVGGDGPG